MLAAGPLEDLTRSASRIYRMEATGEADRVAMALEEKGVTTVEPQANGSLRLTVPEAVPVSNLFAAVLAAGGAVRELAEHRRTLEEVFLGAVQSAGEQE